MTDFQAEQDMEMEALEAILMEELSTLEGSPPSDWPPNSKCYRIAVRSDEEIAEGEYEKKMDLIFAHTPSYPDEAPLVKLSSVQGMTTDDLKQVNSLLAEQIQDNLGMAMIYTLVTALKEWLVDQVATTKETDFEYDEAELAKRKQEAEEQRLAEIRAQGTPVTVSSFAEWKRKFDAEIRAQKAQLEPETVLRDKGPSGKIFFQTQEAGGVQGLGKEMAGEDDFEEELEGTDFDEDDFDEDDDEDEDEEEVLAEILAQKQIS